MLLRLNISNFTSFYEKVSFDMFPNLKRTTFPNHIYLDYEIPLLKQAAIYGANGSGKSNFIEAIKLIKNIVTNRDALKDFPIDENKFRLKKGENEESIKFSAEFVNEGHYFIYNLEIDSDRIRKEELLLSGIGEKEDEPIFLREGSKLESKYANKNEEIKAAAHKLLEGNTLVSLFVLTNDFPFFKNDELVKIANDWFVDKITILSLRRVVPRLIELLSKDNDLMNYTNQIFQEIGIGVKNIEINEINLNNIRPNEIFSIDNKEKFQELKKSIIEQLDSMGGNFSHVKNEKEVWSYEKNENGELIFKQLMFKHIGLNNFEGKMEIETQSDGTAKILNLIPAFYELEKSEKVFFIDEIENSIHPLLMVKLIKYFTDKPTKGQLIYTTHETELLNQRELMRPDEVWFTQKDNGQTRMYSLNDFKEHNTINIKNGYLDGRYGAIPFLGDLKE